MTAPTNDPSYTQKTTMTVIYVILGILVALLAIFITYRIFHHNSELKDISQGAVRVASSPSENGIIVPSILA
jgi:hypothetical protein